MTQPEGDINAPEFQNIEAFFLQFSRSAYGLAIKILQDSDLAEDAVQDAFLKLWKDPNIYNSNQEPFINWLLVVVRNICIEYLLNNKKVELFSFGAGLDVKGDWAERLPDSNKMVEEEEIEILQRAEIQAALKVISHEQYDLIELAFFKGLTHHKIAAKPGLPIGTVKSRIRQGLQKLKVQLDAGKIIEQFNMEPNL